MDEKTMKQMAKMVDALQPHCDERIVAAMTCGQSDYKKFIEANVRTLEPYLNPQWVETLKRISERELTEHKYKLESLYSLLEQDEADALLKKFVAGRVGETFRHMK